MTQPSVTVIMPVRNEESFIGRAISSVLRQDYPVGKMDVVVVDGMSTDRTVQVIHDTYASMTAERHCSPLKVLSNPQRFVASSMNLAIELSGSEVIARVDGHCEVAADHISRCVTALLETGAECAGGVLVTVAESEGARAIAAAQSSVFGVGNALFRVAPEAGRYVDTLAFGTYQREVFTRIGMFDEELVRNQDDELNFRIILSGGRIWLDPRIKIAYYSRANIRTLWKQYYEYGFYKVHIIRKHRRLPSARSIVPFLLLLALVTATVHGIVTQDFRGALIALGTYLSAAGFAAATLRSTRKVRASSALMALMTLHFGYGLGFVRGLVRRPRRIQDPTT